MQKIAKFYKVSFPQFKSDWKETFGNDKNIEEIYRSILLPRRATTGSAGYDFHSPIEIILKAGESVKIPTGIRAEIGDGWVLMCFPRSGLGFKFRMQLDNTVGIIDSDYFYAENEGHIMIKITNDSTEEKTLVVDKGKGFAQGIFVAFGITEDDDSNDTRKGGFGSTN
jgi:dUTP pyrophosphatase